ncbi:Serine/threonine-protein kinase sid2 [Folsomia candida]|uniref:Serine/threonine-protein kinase greatwall n=1 Tax=Folsomia candida TaxID=158441 RepID=A0A226E8L4_FOLCA|nr:Serine/threonine-protein kinase sid2 [Folsomia candida]
MNINIVTTLKRFPRIIRAWNWYKINHYSSLTLLVAVLTIILTNKSEEFEKTEISIIKRRSGETILTVDGVQEIEFDSMIDSMGFLVYEDDYEDCGKLKQVRGSKSTMLLDNWKFSCDPLQRLRLAKRAGYSGIIGYNIPTGYKTPPGVSVSLTLIGESDANILKKYSYPNSVRFYVSSKPVTYVRGRYWFVPDCSVQQLLIYVFITFFTVRFLLVPNEYNILDLYYFYMYPRLKYSELGVNIPIPLSKKLLYYFSSTKYGAYPEPIAYTHIENERVKAIQEINNNNDDFSDFGIGDKDFELVSDISVGTYGNVTKKKFLPTGEQVAVKSILKIYNGSILESEVLQCGNISDAIVRLLYAYESDIYIHFVTDLMQGSLLDFTKLLRKDHAKIFAVELGLGLEALHSFGVAHRDLKPANVFLDQKFHIKIGDFGCSAKLRQVNVTFPQVFVT